MTPLEGPADRTLADEIHALVAAHDGDVATLVRGEVLRRTPLASPREQDHLAHEVLARLEGLGELDHLLRDPGVDEILVNSGRDVWVERDGRLDHVGRLDRDRVELLVERVLAPLGRRLDRTSPIVDARLPDGARVCAVLAPVAVDGTTLSIRRFRAGARPLTDFADGAALDLLGRAIDAHCNIVVCGATSSGKTSLVAAILVACAPGERLIVVEDTAELPIDDPTGARHVVRLEARPATADGPNAIDLAQLVRTALRLRPDRLVVGEVRGDEVTALVQAMNTGHDGSISTCHANGPLDALLRLESLVLQANPGWPLAAIRHQLGRSIDVIVQVARDGARRRVVAIDEVIATGGLDEAERAEAAERVRPLVVRCGERLDVIGDLSRARRTPEQP